MIKPERMKTRSAGRGVDPAESTFEPDPIENDQAEYDEDPEEAYEGGSSEGTDEEPFGSEHVHDAGEQAREKEFVKETVGKINAMYRHNVDNGKLEIGGYLLDEVFGGEIEKAISTNPYKSATFSSIAQDPDLLVEPKTLGSWVRAAAVDRDFNQRDFEFPHLTTYQYVELAKVKDPDRRAEIAQQANDEELPVKALRKHISDENGTGKKPSDKIKQEVQKTMKDFASLSIDEGLLEFLGDKEAIKGVYSAGKALDLIPEVYTSLESVQAAAEILETFANCLDDIVNETRKRPSA